MALFWLMVAIGALCLPIVIGVVIIKTPILFQDSERWYRQALREGNIRQMENDLLRDQALTRERDDALVLEGEVLEEGRGGWRK